MTTDGGKRVRIGKLSANRRNALPKTPHQTAKRNNARSLGAPVDPDSADGRVRRSQRSGQVIVGALFDLVGEGVVAPTAQQVAARAGVGIRTVFRRFNDMESLAAEMDQRLRIEAVPLFRGGERKGSLDDRGRALVRQRVELFERIAPYKRSGNARRWHSPFLQDSHNALVRELRKDIVTWLPELERAGADMVDAMDLVVSFEVWDRLRTDRGISRARAQIIVERLVQALIASIGR